MATNTVEGIVITSTGMNIALEADLAEGTESNLTTNTTYSITAQALGTYANGATITHALVTADSSISYAYVLSEGLIACLIPVGVKGATQDIPQLCKPYTLKAGDQVRVLTLTATARNAAVAVYTSTGTERIFITTPSGSGDQTLVDLQTSNGLGDTLQGQRIVKAQFLSVDASKVETPGAIVIDAQNNVVGSVPMVNPQKVQPHMNSSYPIPVALNFALKFKTNA
jgi:hypothetical protein